MDDWSRVKRQRSFLTKKVEGKMILELKGPSLLKKYNHYYVIMEKLLSAMKKVVLKAARADESR